LKGGQITLGTNSSGRRVAVIQSPFLEGHHSSESFFIVRLLVAMKVKVVKFVLESASTGKSEV